MPHAHKNREKQHPSRAAVLYGSTKLDRDWEDQVAERVRILVSRDGLEPEAAWLLAIDEEAWV